MTLKSFYLILLVIIISSTIPIILAKPELILSTNKTDYYFLVGEEAGFLIDIENQYNISLNGKFSYTIAQSRQQGGMAMQTSNTESKSLTIQEPPQPLVFSLGNPNAPVDLVFQQAEFTFTDINGNTNHVTLPDINIHIITDPNQEQESESAQSEQQSQEERQEQQQKAQEEAEKKREEELREQIRQQEEANKIQNRMQNNQMNQNTNTLKQQMQKDMQESEQQKQEMRNVIQANEKFQQMQQEIQEQGYQQTQENLSPNSSGEGEFSYEYEDQEGNKKEIDGKTENNEVTEISQSTELSQETLLQKIQEDQQYQEYNEQLNQEGFSQEDTQFQNINENKTTATLQYKDNKNNTANIVVDFNEQEIEEVRLERSKSYMTYILSVIATLIVVLLILLRKKKTPQKKEKTSKPIDFTKEAKKMLKHAQKLFDDGNRKDAYSLVSQGVRFFFIHKLNLNKELTNNDLIKNLQNKKIKPTDARKCLNLCSLVEFAKYKANKKDFTEIMIRARKIVSDK